MLVVANFKSYLMYQEEIDYIQKNLTELKNQRADIIICPSLLSLPCIASLLQNSSVSIGAQTVSAHPTGPCTGQISAQALHAIGIQYCIVGHSEDRIPSEEANIKTNIQKIEQLLKNNITPLYCIQELQSTIDIETKKDDLNNQISDLHIVLKNQKDRSFYVAYEPLKSIGTDILPDLNELKELFSWLKKYFLEYPSIKLLYGGSVSSNSIDKLKTIPHIEGFIIGRASLDFQELKKIVSYI